MVIPYVPDTPDKIKLRANPSFDKLFNPSSIVGDYILPASGGSPPSISMNIIESQITVVSSKTNFLAPISTNFFA
jgi:hypothetical protein